MTTQRVDGSLDDGPLDYNAAFTDSTVTWEHGFSYMADLGLWQVKNGLFYFGSTGNEVLAGLSPATTMWFSLNRYKGVLTIRMVSADVHRELHTVPPTANTKRAYDIVANRDQTKDVYDHYTCKTIDKKF